MSPRSITVGALGILALLVVVLAAVVGTRGGGTTGAPLPSPTGPSTVAPARSLARSSFSSRSIDSAKSLPSSDTFPSSIEKIRLVAFGSATSSVRSFRSVGRFSKNRVQISW